MNFWKRRSLHAPTSLPSSLSSLTVRPRHSTTWVCHMDWPAGYTSMTYIMAELSRHLSPGSNLQSLHLHVHTLAPFQDHSCFMLLILGISLSLICVLLYVQVLVESWFCPRLRQTDSSKSAITLPATISACTLWEVTVFKVCCACFNVCIDTLLRSVNVPVCKGRITHFRHFLTLRNQSDDAQLRLIWAN